MYRPKHSRRRSLRWVALAAAMAAGLALAIPAFAVHGDVSLTGSDFEIDSDANLKVDHAAPSLDWANVVEERQADSLSGATDESFGQGTKENTALPTVVNGSIPPNKSDLKFFGVFEEDDTFLHLFWSRVQDPSGTTNMDFELNRLACTPGTNDPDCAPNGLTPLRSAGDILITYDLANGGTNPVLGFREWTGSAWGPSQNLSATGEATGSINTSSIPAAESDGLGAQDPRTFGEGSIRLDAISDPNECLSFGSAYLKSRASDAFTAALKDFVPPEEVEIGARCGAIEITKTRKHAAAGSGDHPHAGVTFTVTGNGVNLSDTTDANGEICFDELFFGTYTVTETVPAGYSANPTSRSVSVDTESTCGDGNEEQATFHNTPLTNITVSVDSQVDGGTASTINCGAGTVSTGPNGDGSTSRNNLAPGTYTCTIVIDP